MNADLLRETVLAMLGGILMWAACRSGHRVTYGKGRAASYCLVTVPSWLSIVCGRPLPDNKLEIGYMLGQIGGLFLSIFWLPMAWLGLDHSQRLIIYSSMYVGTVVISFAVQVTSRLVIRLR